MILKVVPAFIIFLSSFYTSFSQQKICDTVYYNQSWQICEKEIASFYRVGEFIHENNFLYYKGTVKDYTVQHKIIMQGEYSPDGYRNGKFIFYYPDGKPKYEAMYNMGFATGIWNWFYNNGNKKSSIRFGNSENDFVFLNYSDESGKQTLNDSTGDFTWYTIPEGTVFRNFMVEGSFKNGKRSGEWQFYIVEEGEKEKFFKEIYKDGKLKKRVPELIFAPKGNPQSFVFSPTRLQTIESIEYDQFFKKNGKADAPYALLDYLEAGKPSEIKLKYSNFDTAMSFIINNLNYYSHRFEDYDKDVDGRIEFLVSTSHRPEDIQITGTIDTASKSFISFLMSKFRGIEMPSSQSIEVEAYHSIYFYTVDLRPYYPSYARDEAARIVLFSQIPRKQFMESMEANKKKLKKLIRNWYN